MKLSIFSSTLLLAVSVSAGSLFQQQSLGLGSDIEAVAMAGLKKVPGENPLYFCGDTSEDIASIETVDLLPNPPVPFVSPPLLPPLTTHCSSRYSSLCSPSPTRIPANTFTAAILLLSTPSAF